MRDDMMSHATAGALGGAVGTAVLMRAMKASELLPIRLRPPQPRRDPGEFIVGKIERVRGKPLHRGARDALVQGMHWGYGVTSGLLLGLVTSRRHVRSVPSALFAGAAMGTAVWAVGYAGWLPATKLLPPVTRQGGRHVAASILGHVAFGLIAVAPILFVDRRAKRSIWRRALHRLGG